MPVFILFFLMLLCFFDYHVEYLVFYFFKSFPYFFQVDSSAVPTPSLSAHMALLSMQHPVHKLTWRENTSPSLNLKYSPISLSRAPDLDMHIVSLRTITTLPSPAAPGVSLNRTEQSVTGGLVLHRHLIDRCFVWPSSFHEPNVCQPGESCGRVSTVHLI